MFSHLEQVFSFSVTNYIYKIPYFIERDGIVKIKRLHSLNQLTKS